MCVKFIYLVMICTSDEIKQSGIFLLCRLVSNKFKILYTAKNMECNVFPKFQLKFMFGLVVY